EQLPRPSDGALPATSVRLYLGSEEELDRTQLLRTLCLALADRLAVPAALDHNLTDWRNRLWTLGQVVNIVETGVVIWRGTAVDITDDGGLLVEREDGVQQAFYSGDVSVRTA